MPSLPASINSQRLLTGYSKKMVVILRNTKSDHSKRNFWLNFKTFSHSFFLFCGKFSLMYFPFGGVQITPGELILFPNSPTETSILQQSYTATSFLSCEVLPSFRQTANKFVAHIGACYLS